MKLHWRGKTAFTLIEVMVALGLFFLATFTILDLVSQSLRNARRLQQTTIDPGLLAAPAVLNQKLVEGSDSGDFGDLYPDYRWISQTNQAGTNGLFEVDFGIYHNAGDKSVESQLSIFLFRPESPVTPGGGAVRR